MSTQRAAKRPIDKSMVNRAETAIGTTFTNLAIFTATVAQTLIRTLGTYAISKGGATGAINGAIIIILVRDGQTASTPTLASGTALYEPEQDVLWYKTFRLPAGADAVWILDGFFDTSGMRKMKTGDTINLLAISSVADGFDYICSPTTFYKQ